MKILSLLLVFFSIGAFAQRDCPDSLKELISSSSLNKKLFQSI